MGQNGCWLLCYSAFLSRRGECPPDGGRPRLVGAPRRGLERLRRAATWANVNRAGKRQSLWSSARNLSASTWSTSAAGGARAPNVQPRPSTSSSSFVVVVCRRRRRRVGHPKSVGGHAQITREVRRRMRRRWSDGSSKRRECGSRPDNFCAFLFAAPLAPASNGAGVGGRTPAAPAAMLATGGLPVSTPGPQKGHMGAQERPKSSPRVPREAPVRVPTGDR